MIKIEKGIAIPKGRCYKYPFYSMNIGDSFFVEKLNGDLNRIQANIGGACCRIAKKTKMKFLTRMEIKPRGIRVWRIK